MENLAGVDLNLLVVLDALLAERSVTRAGVRLGLSQPAVSNALSRLRGLFGDPLLVRAGARMEPTPRALELAAPVRHALEILGRTLSPSPNFDPARSSHVFRICSADHLELTLLPRLLERLEQIAPGVDIVMSRVSSGVEHDLRTGHVDLYLGVWLDIPSSLQHHLLRHETFACIGRAGHPTIGSRLTLKRYAECGHVLVTPSEWPGRTVDTALSDRGLGRRVAFRTPHLLVAPLVVTRTDLIATLPRSVAEVFAELLPLEVHTPPLDAPGFGVQMVWHPRTHDHAPHRWLRQVVMDLTAEEGW